MWLHAESDYLEEEYQKRLKTIRYEYHNTIKTVIEGGWPEVFFVKQILTLWCAC